MAKITPTPELIKAINYVKSIYPDVTMVIINNQGLWNYCDRNFMCPKFDDRIDETILSDAANSIQNTPFVYELPYEKDEL